MHNLRNALDGILIIAVERQLSDTKLATLLFNTGDLTLQLGAELGLDDAVHTHQLIMGLFLLSGSSLLLTLGAGVIINDSLELLLAFLQLIITLAVFLSDMVLRTKLLLQSTLELLVGAVFLGLQQKGVTKLLTL